MNITFQQLGYSRGMRQRDAPEEEFRSQLYPPKANAYVVEMR